MRGCRGEEETVDKGEEELLTTDGGQTVIDLAMHAPQRMLLRWRWRAQDFATGRVAGHSDSTTPSPTLPFHPLPPLPSAPLRSPPLRSPHCPTLSPTPLQLLLLPLSCQACDSRCAALQSPKGQPHQNGTAFAPGQAGGGGGIETPLNLHWVCFRVGG